MSFISSIDSVQNSMVKHLYSLKVPKKAKDSEDFLCEGFHLVREAFASGLKVRFLFATKHAWADPEGQAILENARREKVRCFESPAKIIAYVSDTVTPQGIVAAVKKPSLPPPGVPFSTLLALYQVQDAGNLGTLFRSAEAFGVQGLLLTEGCCDPFNPKVVRASMGSLFRVPFLSGQTWEIHSSWMKDRGFHCVALALQGSKSLTQARIARPTAFWVGAEGSGLPEELIRSCHESLSIPMSGKVESLNVGVAASLALFWAQNGARFLDTPGGG